MSDICPDQSCATMNTFKGRCAGLTAIQQQQTSALLFQWLALQHICQSANFFVLQHIRKRRNMTVEAWM